MSKCSRDHDISASVPRVTEASKRNDLEQGMLGDGTGDEMEFEILGGANPFWTVVDAENCTALSVSDWWCYKKANESKKWTVNLTQTFKGFFKKYDVIDVH